MKNRIRLDLTTLDARRFFMRGWLILIPFLAFNCTAQIQSSTWDVFVENQTPDLTVTFIIQIPDGRSESATVSPGDAIKVSSVEPGSYDFDAYYTLSATHSEGRGTAAANKLLATGTLDVFEDKVFVIRGEQPRFIVRFEKANEMAN